MIQPYESIFNEFAGKLAELGFKFENIEKYGIRLCRSDGLVLDVSIEQSEYNFLVVLIPPGMRFGDGYAIFFIIEAMDPLRAQRIKKLIGSPQEEYLRSWWQEFCEFLTDHGGKHALNPVPSEVKERYDVLSSERMKEFNLE